MCFGVPVVEGYGQTETTSTVAVLGPDDHKLDSDQKKARLSSVGQVLDDVEVRIVDPLGEVMGPGEHGEVQLRTYRAMDGYWGAEEKTRVTIDDEGWVLRMLERIDVWAQPGSLYDMQGCHLILSLLSQPEAFAEGLTRIVACVEQECRC